MASLITIKSDIDILTAQLNEISDLAFNQMKDNFECNYDYDKAEASKQGKFMHDIEKSIEYLKKAHELLSEHV